MTEALLVLDYAPKKLVSNQGRTETLKRGGGGETVLRPPLLGHFVKDFTKNTFLEL